MSESNKEFSPVLPEELTRVEGGSNSQMTPEQTAAYWKKLSEKIQAMSPSQLHGS